MNEIVITVSPYGSLIIIGVLALALGWFVGYLKGCADTENRHRGLLDKAQLDHAKAVKDLRDVGMGMDRDSLEHLQPGSKVPDGHRCPECFSRDGEAHLGTCTEPATHPIEQSKIDVRA